MAEIHHTPTPKRQLVWNTLSANSVNVRCSTPIAGFYASPNLSPIKDMQARKSPASPMIFKKPLKMVQQPQTSPIAGVCASPNFSPIKDMQARKSPASRMIFKKPLRMEQQPQTTLPPLIKVTSGKISPNEMINNSLDNFLDDSSSCNSSTETSFVKETRRRSLQATNHSYAINHASNVKEMLLLLGLESFTDKFEAMHLDLLDLVSIKSADLKRMGVHKEVDRRSIMDALNSI